MPFGNIKSVFPDLELGIYVTLMGNLGDVIFGTLSRTPYPYNYPHAAHRLWKALAGGTVRDCVVAVLSLDPVVLAANEEALLRPLGGGAA